VKNPIVIFGSSRKRGDTWQAIQLVKGAQDIPIIELSDYDISFYDYEHRNESDDYLTLMERIAGHDPIVLATPVYWYTMSAQMKIFVDRLSDLLAIRKELGRQLRGKTMHVITSYSTDRPAGFEDAFRQTCDYLGMQYGACYYYYAGPDSAQRGLNEANAESFQKNLIHD